MIEVGDIIRVNSGAEPNHEVLDIIFREQGATLISLRFTSGGGLYNYTLSYIIEINKDLIRNKALNKALNQVLATNI